MPKQHKTEPRTDGAKRNRAGRKHIDQCSSGYLPASMAHMQVHHILPVSCLSDAWIAEGVKDNERVDMVKSCLKMTEWDINDGNNTVALPLKPAYEDPLAPTGWDGWPCHQVDHDRYTAEVDEYLVGNVWEPICEEAEECNVAGQSIRGQLVASSNTWRQKLQQRGARPGGAHSGTAQCWDARENPGMEDIWYLPFSMSKNPRRRSPPANFKAFKSDMKAYLSKVFKAISNA